MKITVANLSSNTLAVPFPLNVTLTSGKSVVVVLKDAEWKAVQSSVPVNRLIQAKMLALSIHQDTPVVALAAPEAPAKVEPPKAPAKAPKAPVVAEAPKPEPVAEAPKPEPVAEAPKPEPVAEAPKPEPVAEAPKPEPEAAPAVDPAVDEKKPSKKKVKEGKGW